MRQAETQLKSADGAVVARLPEAYQWLLVPTQPNPGAPIKWEAYRLTGQDALAVRAGKKLRSEELFVPAMAGTRLRMELDRVPLWRGDHVAVRQLAEDFARYPYLPRLRDSSVLNVAIQDGLGLLSWKQETFAYADSFDEASGQYRGLRAGKQVSGLLSELDGLLVKPDVAQAQLDAQTQETGGQPRGNGNGDGGHPKPPVTGGETGEQPAARQQPTRYYGNVVLDLARVGRDAGRIADEVIAHLTGLVGADVKVTLEIEARIPSGAPEHVVRTVTENSRTLKFSAQGFESD